MRKFQVPMMGLATAWSLLLLPCMVLSLNPVCTSQAALNTHMSVEIMSDMVPFYSMTTQGVMLCGRECLYRRMCVAINFNHITNECQLLEMKDYNLISSLRWIYTPVSTFPESIADECAYHTCAFDQMCVPNSNPYPFAYSCEPMTGTGGTGGTNDAGGTGDTATGGAGGTATGRR